MWARLVGATADSPPMCTETPDIPEPLARLVAVIDEPITLFDLSGLVARLEADHGTDLRIATVGGAFQVRTPGRLCRCLTCVVDDAEAYQRLTGRIRAVSLVTCAGCGRTRCPHANHHGNICSG